MHEGLLSPLHLLILVSSPIVFLVLPVWIVVRIVRKVRRKYPRNPDPAGRSDGKLNSGRASDPIPR